MFFNTPEDSKARVTFGPALRHLIVFQLKLGADALRDFVLSPLSIVVFVLDAIRKPALEDSLYLRLMVLGRRSDEYINLFDQHKDKGNFTMDEAIETVARMATDAHEEHQRRSDSD
jgi:hypothetical protein